MVYLDTSIVVSLYFPDAHSARARAFVQQRRNDLAVSPWVGVELESVLNRMRRTAGLGQQADQAIRTSYHGLINGGHVTMLPIDHGDFQRAAALLTIDAPLRSPDALHLALAERHRATLATFDEQLAATAKHHGARSILP